VIKHGAITKNAFEISLLSDVFPIGDSKLSSVNRVGTVYPVQQVSCDCKLPNYKKQALIRILGESLISNNRLTVFNMCFIILHYTLKSYLNR